MSPDPGQYRYAVASGSFSTERHKAREDPTLPRYGTDPIALQPTLLLDLPPALRINLRAR